jgi:hypothetical protein
MLRRILLCQTLVVGLLAGPVLARDRALVAVELFTSQGCAACAAANDLQATLAARPGVLALTFPVDYWDYLGWRDTYAQPAFSQRQKAYAKALGVREVFTPQMVVGGQGQAGEPAWGWSIGETTDALIRKSAQTARGAPKIAFTSGKVRIGAGPSPRGGADVWLVRYRPTPADVTVTTGENRGKTVRYHNLVRELEPLGVWSGRAQTYDQPQSSEGGLKRAVLVQAKDGGRILAAVADPAS